jgi:hypothetical protein
MRPCATAQRGPASPLIEKPLLNDLLFQGIRTASPETRHVLERTVEAAVAVADGICCWPRGTTLGCSRVEADGGVDHLVRQVTGQRSEPSDRPNRSMMLRAFVGPRRRDNGLG